MTNPNDSFFAEPIDPRLEARAMALEVICRLLLWMADGAKAHVRQSMGGGMWREWLGKNFRGTQRTAQKYMRLAETVEDIGQLKGMSLRQVYFNLGIATEPKSRTAAVPVGTLPPHVRLAQRLLVSLMLAISIPCSATLINQTAESITLNGNTSMSYLLYQPPGYSDNNTSWPLVVFLHGSSLTGTNLDLLARQGIASEIEHGRALPGVAVSPLLPSGNTMWNAATMRDFIQQIVARHRIDPERIYVTGLSMGDYGTWAIGTSCPDLIAAIAPICGAGSIPQASVLRDTPVWAFHGALDPTVPMTQSQMMIAAIAQAGGFPRFTLYPFALHNSWSATYANPAFYDWLFAQTRSTATSSILGTTIPAKPVAIAVNQNATFNAQISTAPTAFRWQRLPAISPLWGDLHEGGAYSGTATATLTVGPVVPAMSGDRFRCIINDSDGNTLTTVAATLTVRVPSGSDYPLHAPTGLAFDATGALLVADIGLHTVSRITTDGVATRWVGSVGTNGMLDATGTAALFDQPFGVAVGAGGDLYVSDSANSVVRRITSSGTASLFAGGTDAPGNIDGTGPAARFAVPTGIAIDSSGSLFVTDAFSDTIRQITAAAAVTTLAGSPTDYGSSDGPGRTARFNYPNGIVVDGNSLLVADTDNHTIRRITSDGTTSTCAGAAGQVGRVSRTGRPVGRGASRTGVRPLFVDFSQVPS